MQLFGYNVVIAANQFNPSVLTQLWLVRNHVVAEEDFRPGSAFTDAFVMVQSRQFQLFVIPQQLQFTPQCAPEEEAELVAIRVGGIVEALPHTPYTAIGLNINWHVTRAEGDVLRLARDLFYKEGTALYRLFGTEDAHFGGYLSKDVLGCRLKLDIKPITLPTDSGPEDRLQFLFNFHLDLAKENPVAEIRRMLGQWDTAKREAQSIVETVTRQ